MSVSLSANDTRVTQAIYSSPQTYWELGHIFFEIEIDEELQVFSVLIMEGVLPEFPTDRGDPTPGEAHGQGCETLT